VKLLAGLHLNFDKRRSLGVGSDKSTKDIKPYLEQINEMSIDNFFSNELKYSDSPGNT
jgi:hypothetical protein